MLFKCAITRDVILLQFTSNSITSLAITDSIRCDCGNPVQNVKHIVQECPSRESSKDHGMKYSQRPRSNYTDTVIALRASCSVLVNYLLSVIKWWSYTCLIIDLIFNHSLTNDCC